MVGRLERRYAGFVLTIGNGSLFCTQPFGSNLGFSIFPKDTWAQGSIQQMQTHFLQSGKERQGEDIFLCNTRNDPAREQELGQKKTLMSSPPPATEVRLEETELERCPGSHEGKARSTSAPGPSRPSGLVFRPCQCVWVHSAQAGWISSLKTPYSQQHQ